MIEFVQHAALRVGIFQEPVAESVKRFQRDIFRALRTVRRLRAGIVWVNQTQISRVEAPWGGVKQSGFGRELGRWGVDEYLQTKQVYLSMDERPMGWFSGNEER